MKHFVMSVMMGALLSGTIGIAAADNEVNDRQRDQQQRIGAGVENGSLTPHETAHLENQEGAIHREVKQDRKANGGKLTAQEHAQVSRQQNRESRRIFRDKHNGKNQ